MYETHRLIYELYNFISKLCISKQFQNYNIETLFHFTKKAKN